MTEDRQLCSIREWIAFEKKEPDICGESREGYFTNLSPDGTGMGDDVGRKAESHQTIRAEHAFAKEEQVKVAMETVNAADRRNGIHRFVTRFHNHDFFELIFVFQGHCTTTIEGKAGMLTEGDICIYNLEAVHQLGIEDEDSVIFNIIMKKEWFHSTLLPLLDSTNPISAFFTKAPYHIESPAGHLVFSYEEGSEARAFVLTIIAEFYRKKEMYQNMMYVNLAGLFIALARQYEKRIANRSIGEDRVDIVRVISYISVNYREITLEDLADHFNYTKRTMIRLIKKYTYRTFSNLVMEFRMNRACALLKEDRLTIEEIASEAGYGDRGYFDKVFKQYHRITPARYRKEYQRK